MYLFSNTEENVCIICWENENNIYKLKDIIFENNICECNVYVHIHCLKQWVKKHNCCPICKVKYNCSRVGNIFLICKYYNTIVSLLVAFVFIDTIYFIVSIIKQYS